MKILALAYYFPPNGGSGSLRNAKMIKSLAQRGGEISIHTVEASDDGLAFDEGQFEAVHRTSCFYPVDILIAIKKRIFGIDSDVPNVPDKGFHHSDNNGEIVNAPFSKKYKDFVTDAMSLPDREVMWFFFSILSALRHHKRRDIDVIYAVGKPWVALMAAVVLAKLYRRPLVIDFMDPWVGNPTTPRRAKLIEKIDNALEKWTIRNANWVIANTAELQRDIENRYPFAKGKIGVITCGYDPADFDEPIQILEKERPGLLMAHAGSLYEMRNPQQLLMALEKLLQSGRLAPDTFKLQLIGHLTVVSDEVQRLIDTLTAAGVLELYGRMSFDKAVAMMQCADIALIVQPIAKLQIPAKLYEYVYSKKPMFAIVEPDGAVERIIEENNWGLTVVNDANEIERKILAMFNTYNKEEALATFNEDVVAQYSYDELGKSFLQQIAGLVAKNRD